jgi:hypothetical protein
MGNKNNKQQRTGAARGKIRVAPVHSWLVGHLVPEGTTTTLHLPLLRHRLHPCTSPLPPHARVRGLVEARGAPVGGRYSPRASSPRPRTANGPTGRRGESAADITTSCWVCTHITQAHISPNGHCMYRQPCTCFPLHIYVLFMCLFVYESRI